MAPVDFDPLLFQLTPIDCRRLRMSSTPVDNGRLRTTRTPNNSGRPRIIAGVGSESWVRSKEHIISMVRLVKEPDRAPASCQRFRVVVAVTRIFRASSTVQVAKVLRRCEFWLLLWHDCHATFCRSFQILTTFSPFRAFRGRLIKRFRQIEADCQSPPFQNRHQNTSRAPRFRIAMCVSVTVCMRLDIASLRSLAISPQLGSDCVWHGCRFRNPPSELCL